MNELARVSERTLAREVARLAAKPELTAAEIEALVSARTLATTHQSTLDVAEVDSILNATPAGGAGRTARPSASTQPGAPGTKETILRKPRLEQVERQLASDPNLQRRCLDDENGLDALTDEVWAGDGKNHFERKSQLRGLLRNRARRGRTALATGGAAC